ncbi:DUF1554 domain-containing protein [Leptospira meyeri]|nr:hypothetical protein CH381_26130 [Leptospira sp. mixed culture ATI2-C-A1]TGM24195.1 DUF1554 domain-containing protein [Leptospira meyeri]TGM64598.1 DUF1554 domain-containing protein [Leptospira meyeri]TGM68077.1 DUF1554 domain-containing protein [Leptospira meyeri]
MVEPKHRTLFFLLKQISLNLLLIFLISCANESLNNTCDINSKSYFETSLILTATGEKKHPCYPGVRIVSNPGLNLSSYRGIISEFGGNAIQGSAITFELFLGMAPKDIVSVQVIVSNPSYATVSPTSFVWTPTDWEGSKFITVTAVNDTVINGTRNFTIRLSPTSNDNSMRLQDQFISMDILDNDKIIFLTTGSYTGILGGVFGADAICQADAKCPAGKICKAMLADAGSDSRQASNTANLGDGQIDWVLKPFATYLRNDSPTVIGTTTAASLFTFPIVGIRPTSATAWTGLSADWTSNANHCGSWTLNTGNGNAGDTAGTTTSAIGFSNFPCNSNLPFYCVEQ